MNARATAATKSASATPARASNGDRAGRRAKSNGGTTKASTKPADKQSASKKATTAKTGASAASAKKPPAKKAAAKKAPAKSTATKSTATKSSAPKSTGTKSTNSTTTKGTAAKKAPTKSTAAKKSTATKAPAKKAATKKTTTKKTTAKKTTATKTAAKKTTAKKATAKKAASATTGTKKAAASKTAPKKAAAVPATSPGVLPIREGEDPWTEEELAEVRTELESEIARLADQIEVSETELVGLLRDGSEGAGRDPADVGSTNFERDHEMSLANNARELLDQTRLALRHISEGTYGICDNCGRPIGKGRLQAFPRATLCMECKQREERR